MNTPTSPPVANMVAPRPLSAASLRTALVGAVGGFLGFLVGEVVDATFFHIPQEQLTLGSSISSSGWWMAFIGAVLGGLLLAYDNLQSLRGQWHRNLLAGSALFFAFSFLGGAAGQAVYVVDSGWLTRGAGWALMGLGMGAGIGVLRRDVLQLRRGALGGALGGLIGGLVFDPIANLLPPDVAMINDGLIPRCIGLVITGALIGLLIRVLQDAMRESWLRGVSEGPYKGREYPLNVGRITVGPTEANDICLFRERELPPEVGAFVREGGTWWWRGLPTIINGAKQSAAPLQTGDVIQFGANHFRFESRQLAPSALADYQPSPTNTAYGASAAYSSPSYGAANPHGSSGPYGSSGPHGAPFGGPAGSALPTSGNAISQGAVSSAPPPDIHALPSTFIGAPAAFPSAAPFSNAAPSTAHSSASPIWPVSPPLVALPLSQNASFVGRAWVLRNALGTELRPTMGDLTLGRNPENALCVPDDTVSSRHARLEVTGELLRLTDLGSTNGTWVNGTQLLLNLPRDLRPGDLLRLGRTEWTVERE